MPFVPDYTPEPPAVPPLTRAQREILAVFIGEYFRTGCPPPLKVVEDITGKGQYVKQAVRVLVAKTYLRQPYGRGPYLPVRTLSGAPLLEHEDHPMAKKPAAGFAATTVLKRSDFGMDMFVPYVGDEITVTFHAETLKADATN